MISIIIASANMELLKEVKKNISETIDLPHEILAFDNSDGRKGICEIYNQGIHQAKYDLLCFMHEDVAIQTKGWGAIVTTIFKNNKDLGIIGVAGSTYKSLTPSGWLSYSDIDTEYSNLLQSFKYHDYKMVHQYRNPDNKKLAPVVAVDGVWLCVQKLVALKTFFDETTFKKFHGYDLDFCLSVGRKYEIAVTFDVLLHHYSEGNFTAEWVEEILKLHRKWQALLPVYTKPFTPKQVYRIERQSFKSFLKKLIALGFPASVAYTLIWKERHFRKLGLKFFTKLNYYLFKYFVLGKRRSKNQVLSTQ